jgi:hypothetical protein
MFDFPKRQEISRLSITSRAAVDPIQAPMQPVQGAVSLEVKRQGRESDHLPLSRAEVRSDINGTMLPRLHTP